MPTRRDRCGRGSGEIVLPHRELQPTDESLPDTVGIFGGEENVGAQAPNDSADRGDSRSRVEGNAPQLGQELAPITDGDDEERAVSLQLIERARERVEDLVGDVGNDDDADDLRRERVGEGEITRDRGRRRGTADVRKELHADREIALGPLGETVGGVRVITPDGLDRDRQLERDPDRPA
jgi:hypothetical protein